MSELKPCPFCGSDVKWCGEHEDDPSDNHLCDHIQCTNTQCKADFSFVYGNELLPDECDDMSPEEIMDIFRQKAVSLYNSRVSHEETNV
ncbi:Lar family restriction alleviation protein [Enterobacter roggenkampii]|uniref:Lar family restriction alleviation protein n=1 Tax=Enterobacter roggenkampii TaxID=1812935 RepID=UPI002003052B|nr:Lar family restriction alleviation protein [Enterobacter roggenkampii]MCK6840533.1 Lar family restriction alleviation protein [Enterobacter roggenkampii]